MNPELIADKLVIITEILLYISFSLLMGGLLTYAIPQAKRPTIDIPKKLLLQSVALIPTFSFAPLMETNIILSENLGFWVSLQSIIFSFEIGKAWLFTLGVSIVLYILIHKNDLENNPSIVRTAIFLTVLLALGIGYAGHASSITQWFGFVVHSVHFLAVIIWVGLMLMIAWFSKDHTNWQAFLKWFTPLAMICVVILTIAGYLTMGIDIQNYDNPNALSFRSIKKVG